MCIIGLIFTILELILIFVWDFIRYGIPLGIIVFILYYLILWIGSKIEDRKSNKK